ncbi:MAG: hypothetical protein KDE58_11275, partial [Caldilineaceae bacterium]|nr:hypothetical protein [Caldilineaceae bacterium]
VIAQGYAMGKARLVMQAKAHFEEMNRGRSRIVVTELPYQTNKTALIERIATLARDAKIEGITDLRDESDRTGMRIVIELTRNADPKDVLKDLFKYTPLQQTFGMQMLALVDGQPRLLSLKRALHLFIQHREVIIRRRSEYELAKARARAHIVEGLLKALDILDEVIATIRRSQTVETARNNLVKNFKFTEIQAQAILDMQLRRLAALERKKLKDEYDELLARIAYLEDLLAHPEKILAVIRQELLDQKEKYGDARRTQIVDRTKGTLTTTDLIPQQDVWVTLSAEGELRRHDVTRLGESALRQMAKYGEVAMVTANTRDFLYLFCRDGRCAKVQIHELPQNGSPKHVADLSEFTRRDMITAALSIPRISADQAQGYLFLATALGEVKRVAVADVVSNNNAEFPVMAVDPKDRLGWVFPTPGEQDVMLVTAEGQSIRFHEEDVRSMGLPAGGVAGIKLKKKDLVIHAQLVDSSGEGVVVTMTTQGYAKRSALSEYSRQGRNGSGIITHKPTTRTGLVVAAMLLEPTVGDEELIAVISAKRQVKPLPVGAIPVMGRGVQGKQVVEFAKSDLVSALQRISESPAPNGTDPFFGNGTGFSTPPSTNGSSDSSGSTPAHTNGTTDGAADKPTARTTKAKNIANRPSKRQAVKAKTTEASPRHRAAVPSENTGKGRALPPREATGKARKSRVGSGATATEATVQQGTLLDLSADNEQQPSANTPTAEKQPAQEAAQTTVERSRRRAKATPAAKATKGAAATSRKSTSAAATAPLPLKMVASQGQEKRSALRSVAPDAKGRANQTAKTDTAGSTTDTGGRTKKRATKTLAATAAVAEPKGRRAK